MKMIGITGPSGSGKSMVGQIFRDLGICVLDADEIYHSLLLPPSDCLSAIRSAFGNFVFCEDGSLDRAALAKIVFSDKEKLRILNSITHKYVTEKMIVLKNEREKLGDKLVALDVPLLFEAKVDELFDTDLDIAVLASKDIRVERILMRDGISKDAAIARIEAQPSDEFYISRADVVVYNENGEDELKRDIIKIIGELL